VFQCGDQYVRALEINGIRFVVTGLSRQHVNNCGNALSW